MQQKISAFWWILEGYVFDGGFLSNSENVIVIDDDLKEIIFLYSKQLKEEPELKTVNPKDLRALKTSCNLYPN